MREKEIPKNVLELLDDKDLEDWDRWNCSILAPESLGSPPVVTVRLENKDGWLRDIKLRINRPVNRGHFQLIKLRSHYK